MRLYRHLFKPSETLARPYAMIGVPVVAAPTDEEARRLSTTQQLKFLSLVRGNRLQLQPPVDSMDGLWNEWEREAVNQRLGAAIVLSLIHISEPTRHFKRSRMPSSA